MTDFTCDKRDSDIVIIRWKGRLNMVSAPRLRNVVTDQVRQGYVKVVVDMTEVDFIDSSGLGALIGCLKTAREHGGDLRISGVGKQVATVLRISNIDRILSPRADAESAFDE